MSSRPAIKPSIKKSNKKIIIGISIFIILCLIIASILIYYFKYYKPSIITVTTSTITSTDGLIHRTRFDADAPPDNIVDSTLMYDPWPIIPDYSPTYVPPFAISSYPYFTAPYQLSIITEQGPERIPSYIAFDENNDLPIRIFA